MRSLPFTTGGRTRSRPGLRLRYFRVGGSLPMGHRLRHRRLLTRAIVDRLQLDAALARDPSRRRQTLQAVHRRPHHVVRVRRPQTLRENVTDPGALEHRAHRPTRDHARSRRSRLEQHATGAVLADDLVRDRTAGQRDFVHAPARGLDRFAYRLADLVRLAGRNADLPFAVADGNEGVEAEAPATFHDFRDAVDRDDVLDHAVAFAPVTAIALTPLAAATSAPATATPPPRPRGHAARAVDAAVALRRPVEPRRPVELRRPLELQGPARSSKLLFLLLALPLELQSSLTCPVRDRLYAGMILVATTV